MRFKTCTRAALQEVSDGNYSVETLSIFKYADGEVIRYIIEKENLEESKETLQNTFYVFLPFSTKRTRVVAKVCGSEEVELRSFYGDSLHKNIAFFMLDSFENKNVVYTSR